MESVARERFIALHDRLVRGEGDRIELGYEISSLAFGAVGGDDWIAHPIWLLWGALTDLWDRDEPSDGRRAEVEADMIDAANGFLDAHHDDDALRRYFDDWLYERMGYELPD